MRERRKRIPCSDNIDVMNVASHYYYYYHHHQRMPSFKERFRPSRKYKKAKDASAINIDETTVASASSINTNTTSTTTTSIVIDELGATNSTIFHSHYSADYCK